MVKISVYSVVFITDNLHFVHLKRFFSLVEIITKRMKPQVEKGLNKVEILIILGFLLQFPNGP